MHSHNHHEIDYHYIKNVILDKVLAELKISEYKTKNLFKAELSLRDRNISSLINRFDNLSNIQNKMRDNFDEAIKKLDNKIIDNSKIIDQLAINQRIFDKEVHKIKEILKELLDTSGKADNVVVEGGIGDEDTGLYFEPGTSIEKVIETIIESVVEVQQTIIEAPIEEVEEDELSALFEEND